MRDRRRWADGESGAGPVWPPVADGGQAQIVRVERHEVIETVGTAEQIARSGVIVADSVPGRPGGRVGEVYRPAGELRAETGSGGLLMNALEIIQDIELWLVRLLAIVLGFGARHPRLVLWGGGFWVVSVLVSR